MDPKEINAKDSAEKEKLITIEMKTEIIEKHERMHVVDIAH